MGFDRFCQLAFTQLQVAQMTCVLLALTHLRTLTGAFNSATFGHSSRTEQYARSKEVSGANLTPANHIPLPLGSFHDVRPILLNLDGCQFSFGNLKVGL